MACPLCNGAGWILGETGGQRCACFPDLLVARTDRKIPPSIPRVDLEAWAQWWIGRQDGQLQAMAQGQIESWLSLSRRPSHVVDLLGPKDAKTVNVELARFLEAVEGCADPLQEALLPVGFRELCRALARDEVPPLLWIQGGLLKGRSSLAVTVLRELVRRTLQEGMYRHTLLLANELRSSFAARWGTANGTKDVIAPVEEAPILVLDNIDSLEEGSADEHKIAQTLEAALVRRDLDGRPTIITSTDQQPGSWESHPWARRTTIHSLLQRARQVSLEPMARVLERSLEAPCL